MEDYVFKISVRPEDASLVAQRFKEFFGFQIKINGGEVLILKDRNSGLPFKRNFLLRNHEISLEADPKEISGKLYKTINQEVLNSGKRESSRILNGKGSNITVPAQLGWISESEEIHINLAFTFDEKGIRELIENKLIPFVTDKRIKAKYILPITSTIELPRFLSLVKMTQIVKEHSLEKAEEYRDKGAFEGISLDINSPLKLVNSLSRLGSFSFSLPFLKDGSVWHVYGKGVFNFPYLFTQSFTETFLLRTSPRLELELELGLKTPKFGEDEIWMFFAQLNDGVNNFFSFLLDPMNFIREDKELDLINQLKALGAAQLLIADLESANYSQALHTRLSFSLLALDKLANIKKAFSGSANPETNIFESFFSDRQKEKNEKIFKNKIPFSRKGLLQFLSAINKDCYSSINEKMRQQIDPDASEVDLLRRVRNLRNLHHGTFLNRLQFEDLFSRNNAFLPEKVVYLPFLLTYALLLDPRGFLTD